MWLVMMLAACQEEEEQRVPPAPDCAGDEARPTWPDADGDGHGDPLGASETLCEVPAGRSLTDDDCDDADSAVYPGAPERCDGRANDCALWPAAEQPAVELGEQTFLTLQEALDAAAEGDEVRLCAGTYTGTFTAPVAVSIVGAGRDLTTLDGGDAGTVLRVAPGSRVAGLTVTQGQAEVGGGLSLTAAGELVVADCALLLNRAQRGGGVALPGGSTASFPGTLVQINAAVEGGGIFAGPGSSLDLTGATIDDNRADYGGGISGVELTVVGGQVTNNSAEDHTGSPHYHSGGGILLQGSSSVTGTEIASNTGASSGGGISMSAGELVLLDVWLHDNRAESAGGGLSLSEASGILEGTTLVGPGNEGGGFGGGVDLAGGGLVGGEISGNHSYEGGGIFANQAEMHEVWVHDNTADVGGGVDMRGGSLLDSIIEDNHGNWTGGLLTIASGYGSVSVSDTIVRGNVSQDSSGGVNIDADDAPNTVFTRVTVTDNQGTDGAGISVWWGRARLVDSVVMRNQATADGGAALLVGYEGAIEVSGSDLGEGVDDNGPNDVSTSQGGAFHGYGADSAFVCNSQGCTPTPGG